MGRGLRRAAIGLDVESSLSVSAVQDSVQLDVVTPALPPAGIQKAASPHPSPQRSHGGTCDSRRRPLEAVRCHAPQSTARRAGSLPRRSGCVPSSPWAKSISLSLIGRSSAADGLGTRRLLRDQRCHQTIQRRHELVEVSPESVHDRAYFLQAPRTTDSANGPHNRGEGPCCDPADS